MDKNMEHEMEAGSIFWFRDVGLEGLGAARNGVYPRIPLSTLVSLYRRARANMIYSVIAVVRQL